MTEPAGGEVHRLCRFDLWLNCGHIATVSLEVWYPVTVACCDRLGGTILRGQYVPYASHVDYVTVLAEDYQVRPAGSPRQPTRVLSRRPRIDEPCPPGHTGHKCSAGRYLAWVGATWNVNPHRDPAQAS